MLSIDCDTPDSAAIAKSETATAVDTARHGRSRGPLRLVSVVVLLLLLVVTAGATLVVRRVVREEERRLLGERANEAATLIATSFAPVGSTLRGLATTALSDPNNSEDFATHAHPLVQAQGAKAVLLGSEHAGNFEVVSGIGAAPATGTMLGGEQAALMARALTAKDFVSAVINDRGTFRLAFALRSGAPGEVVYFESAIDPTRPVASTANSAFHELRGIVYAAPRADPSRIVVKSQAGTALSGAFVGRTFPVGADTWYVATGARQPLVGSFAQDVPWVILGVGLLAALMATMMVEVLARRRLFALALVEERTASLRERQATLDAVFATCPDVIHVLDTDGVTTEVSPAVERLLGYPTAQLVGRPITDVVEPDDRGKVSALIARLVGGEADDLVGQYRARHRNGEIRVLESLAAALRDHDGSPTSLVVVTRDMTERAQLERAHHDARVAAEDANRSKSEFLSRMSHELRTPLNAVLGFAQLLEMDALNSDQQDAVDHIMRGGRHLLDLINEVLDISRIETGALALSSEPVLLRDVLQESVELVSAQAVQRDVRIAVSVTSLDNQFILADRQRLKQIMVNLLSNAIKYNRQGGHASVSVEPIGQSRIRINVSDSGPGITNDKLDRLFIPFDRLGAEQTDVEGTGIGLALSRRLAESMGGRLDLHTTPGVGSTFWVELPSAEGPIERYERQGGLVSPNPPADTSIRQRTVVHVEDNLTNLKLVERILAQRSGTHLVPATQGHVGIDLIRQRQPDLVLLDLHLPDINGDEVLRTLRDDPITAAIPIVILSADATSGQAQRLLAAGADGYLTKPLDVRQLLDLLDTVWNRDNDDLVPTVDDAVGVRPLPAQ